MSETPSAPEARPPPAASPARDAVKPKKLTRRTLTIAVAGLLLVAAAGAVYWRFVRAVDVPVAVATQGAIAARVVGPGTVQARVPITLSARVSATVVQVHADVGDSVHPGQLLVTLDDRDLSARRGVVAGQQEALHRNTEGARAALVKAQADLELARGKQRRDAELLTQGFVLQAAQLSGGEQQRVAIGRALANEPVLILADEPTAALDTQRGTKVMAMLRQIARDRRSAVIAVTNDHRMIEGFDTVYHLEHGRLARVDHHAQVADATPA